MRRSFSSISTSALASSRYGTASNEAKAVWRRDCESNGEIRTSRWTPFSPFSSP